MKPLSDNHVEKHHVFKSNRSQIDDTFIQYGYKPTCGVALLVRSPAFVMALPGLFFIIIIQNFCIILFDSPIFMSSDKHVLMVYSFSMYGCWNPSFLACSQHTEHHSTKRFKSLQSAPLSFLSKSFHLFIFYIFLNFVSYPLLNHSPLFFVLYLP